MISYKSLLILPALVGHAVSSEFCRPLPRGKYLNSCPESHPFMAKCSGIYACCPSGVTKDWRGNDTPCAVVNHDRNLEFKDTVTFDDGDVLDLGEASASLRSSSAVLLASSLVATAVLGFN